jgi:hypothetical protein
MRLSLWGGSAKYELFDGLDAQPQHTAVEKTFLSLFQLNLRPLNDLLSLALYLLCIGPCSLSLLILLSHPCSSLRHFQNFI